MKFLISYNFEGKGTATVKAKNRQEAEDKFFDGECDYHNDEEQTNFNIELIVKA